MPPDHAAITSAVSQYADALGATLEAAGGLVEFFRSLRDPVVRARRLRRKAGRLWRVANRADGRGFEVRAANLRDRAAEAWREAQQIVPLNATAAVHLDRGAA